jgi:hypothetical protein
MIPGFEYEQPNNNGYTTSSSPSPSLHSVDMSPQTSYGLHQRRRPNSYIPQNNSDYKDYTPSKAKGLAKKLDLFPKLERDYEVRTERGGRVSIVGYFVLMVLIMAEIWEWRGLNDQNLEGVVVDTRLVLCCFVLVWCVSYEECLCLFVDESKRLMILSRYANEDNFCVIVQRQILFLSADDSNYIWLRSDGIRVS